MDSRRETRVGDARGCVGLFGGVFVLSGTFATALALFGEMPDVGSRLGALVIGLAHLGGGLWVGWGESRTAVVRRSGVVITHRRLLRGASATHVGATDVLAVEVHESRDDEGDAVFAPRLRVRFANRSVELTSQASPSREHVVEMAAAVARRLALPDAVEWSGAREP